MMRGDLCTEYGEHAEYMYKRGRGRGIWGMDDMRHGRLDGTEFGLCCDD